MKDDKNRHRSYKNKTARADARHAGHLLEKKLSYTLIHGGSVVSAVDHLPDLLDLMGRCMGRLGSRVILKTQPLPGLKSATATRKLTRTLGVRHEEIEEGSCTAGGFGMCWHGLVAIAVTFAL